MEARVPQVLLLKHRVGCVYASNDLGPHELEQKEHSDSLVKGFIVVDPRQRQPSLDMFQVLHICYRAGDVLIGDDDPPAVRLSPNKDLVNEREKHVLLRDTEATVWSSEYAGVLVITFARYGSPVDDRDSG